MPSIVALLVAVAILGLGHGQVPVQSSGHVSSQPSSPRHLAEPEAPRGIKGFIGGNGAFPSCPALGFLGNHTLPIPPPPPSGSILVRDTAGREAIVTIHWFWDACVSAYLFGTFQVTLHPGSYSVDFTGDSGVCIEPHQLPLSVTVEPHGFTQVSIHILTFQTSTCRPNVS
jgi:hypothetical protein